MKSLADLRKFFDLVVVLNLPSRMDRWRRFQQRLPSDWPFAPPLRFPAIDGRSLTRPAWWRGGAGAWGCYLSHMAILRDCLRHGVESVLILEDDVAFAPDFSEQVRSYIAHLPSDWQFIYFGGQHIQVELGGPTRVNAWVYRPYNVNRTHAYALRGQSILQRVYDFLNIEAEWPLPHHIDHRLGALHKKLQSGLYVPKNWLAIQAQDRSDIAGKKVETMFFRGAQWLCEARPAARMVAVLSARGKPGQVVAGFLHVLGVKMRGDSQNADQSNPLEDAALSFVARNCFDEQSLSEKVPSKERERLLRLWAADRSELWKPRHGLLAGKHPLLCLMGEDLSRAWENPFFIVVNEDDTCVAQAPTIEALAALWASEQQATARLIEARETFLASHPVPHIRINFKSLVTNPLQHIEALASNLQFSPQPDEVKSAVNFLESYR